MRNWSNPTANRTRCVFAILSVAVLALTLAATPVMAQASGSTDIDITLPDIVILHYYSDIDVNISAAVLGTLLTGVAGDSEINEGVPASVTHVSDLTYDTGMVPSALTGGDPSALVLTLLDAWAVRSISLLGGTDTELDIDVTTTTLDGPGATAEIEITNWAVDDGSGAADPLTFAAPGLANPVVGDVELTLDLTAATEAGDYVDGVFLLTATNI